MKKFIQDFLFRGFMSAAGGPVVLAIIYGILGKLEAVESLAPREVCLGILSVTLLAFAVAGMGAIYRVESLPLGSAIAIHGAALYGVYILIYWINGWIRHQADAILTFTLCFVIGYALIWLLIYLVQRGKTRQVNQMLHADE